MVLDETKMQAAMYLGLGSIIAESPPKIQSVDTFRNEDATCNTVQVFRECHFTVSTSLVNKGVGDQDLTLDFHMI